MMKKMSLLTVVGIILGMMFVSCASTDKVKAGDFKTDWVDTELTDLTNCGYFYTSQEIGQFDMIEGEFKKATGYKKSAYGFIFGYSTPTKDGKIANYIRFEVNPDGEFAIYKVEGSSYKDLIETNDKGTAFFYPNDSVVKGYDAVNKLKIELNANKKFDTFINGKKVLENIEPLQNGTFGVVTFFSVGEANQEKLPEEPVKVSYRITDGIIHTEK